MVIQLQVPDEVTRRFDELARHAGQSREEVILEAMEAYLAQVAEEDARIDEALAQVARGEVVDAEEIRAEDEALLARLGVTPEQLAAIDEEIRHEFEEFYGVSLCE